MSEPSRRSPEPWPTYARLCAISLAAAVGVVLVSVGPVRWFSGADAVWALLLGAGVAWLGSLAAAVPVCVLLRRGPRELAFGLLAGIILRFLVTLALGLTVWGLRLVPGDAVLIWVGVVQLVLLAVDSAAQLLVVRLAAAGVVEPAEVEPGNVEPGQIERGHVQPGDAARHRSGASTTAKRPSVEAPC